MTPVSHSSEAPDSMEQHQLCKYGHSKSGTPGFRVRSRGREVKGWATGCRRPSRRFAAVALRRWSSRSGRGTAGERLGLRLGLHLGEVFARRHGLRGQSTALGGFYDIGGVRQGFSDSCM